jgi:curved DNA-binding protein CbpA
VNQRDGSNYYEILEVSHDAPQSEVHKAYQRAKTTYSQDNPALYSMFSRDEAKELLRMIEEAFAVLGNAGTRRAYDESLNNPNSSAPRAVVANQETSAVSNPSKVAADHKALPDFTNDSVAAGREEFSVRKKEATKASVPDGMAKTGLSTYKIDTAFDNEIKAATEFEGTFLQKIRLYKNISIEKLSEVTRISRTYLMAVETNDYKNLPAAVFVRGFVVQIARHLGLEENKVVASYMKHFKAGGGK